MTMHDQSPLRAETWREHPGLSRLTSPGGRAVFVAARHDDVRTVSLIEMDPPEHGPARRAVAGEFTIRRMRELRPEVQCIVDGLPDDETALRQRLRVLGIGAPGHLVMETKSAGRQPCVDRVAGEAVRFAPVKF
ncbi:hypothetical protein AB0C81_30535 [Streptomyces roseoverticillatus]|uniref:hypothetical protein n=1 Tax=Streptomyces roseoverticillatus TaxID=66429 RepID=UPI0033FA357E